MPPTSATVPSSGSFAAYELRSRMARTDWRTFSSATLVTQPASFESLQCAASTAGCILASRPVRLPSCTPSIAPLTAPQLVCPSTTMSFAPTLTAYSRLPSSSSFTTLPPKRTAKTSPIPWSKTISTGARESMQPSTATKGNWPAAVATTLADQSRRRVAFAAKRALPAFRRSSACDGVIAACDARVCTSGFEGAAAGSSAVATRAPSARHKTTAEALRRVEPSRRSGGRRAPLGVRLEGRTGNFPSSGLSPDQFTAGSEAARWETQRGYSPREDAAGQGREGAVGIPGLHRQWRRSDRGTRGRQAVEVEHILEIAGVRIPGRETREREALLRERENGDMTRPTWNASALISKHTRAHRRP